MIRKSNPQGKGNQRYTAISTYDAGVMQASVNRSLQKYSDLLLKPYGITKAQWLLIGTVYDAGASGVRLSDLAVKLDTTLAYLTNTINLLESKKILKRAGDTGDSRVKQITVHPSFRPKCDEIELALRKGLRKLVYSHVSLEDFNVYMKVLHQLTSINKPN